MACGDRTQADVPCLGPPELLLTARPQGKRLPPRQSGRTWGRFLVNLSQESRGDGGFLGRAWDSGQSRPISLMLAVYTAPPLPLTEEVSDEGQQWSLLTP